MRILVTGGAGYIGSIVVENLCKVGHDPIVIDNLKEGNRNAVDSHIPFYESDYGDLRVLENIFYRHNPEAVMHFAAEAIVSQSMTDPDLFFQTNVQKGITLLGIMARFNCQIMVFSSTAAVYGEPKYIPIDEDHPIDPINPYGESKWLYERILKWYFKAYNIRYNVFRYFNAAGASKIRGEAHRNETHLIPAALNVLLGKSDRLYVHGSDYPTPDGTCIRDFVHVLDIAAAHILALENAIERPQSVYNLGSGRGYSVLEVLKTIEQVTGRSVRWEFAPRRPGDPAVLVASSERARSELGWKPKYSSLEEMVRSAWEWHRTHPNGYE